MAVPVPKIGEDATVAAPKIGEDAVVVAAAPKNEDVEVPPKIEAVVLGVVPNTDEFVPNTVGDVVGVEPKIDPVVVEAPVKLVVLPKKDCVVEVGLLTAAPKIVDAVLTPPNIEDDVVPAVDDIAPLNKDGVEVLAVIMAEVEVVVVPILPKIEVEAVVTAVSVGTDDASAEEVIGTEPLKTDVEIGATVVWVVLLTLKSTLGTDGLVVAVVTVILELEELNMVDADVVPKIVEDGEPPKAGTDVGLGPLPPNKVPDIQLVFSAVGNFGADCVVSVFAGSAVVTLVGEVLLVTVLTE